MPHPFTSVASWAVRPGLIVLLTAGVLIGAVRLALPFADRFQSELVGKLAQTLGTELRVGHLELRLAGLTPRLGLRDLVIPDPVSGDPRLSFEQLWVDLNPIASLRAWAPRIGSVTLMGTRLTVKRLSTGAIVVTELEGLTGRDPEALGFFLGNGRLQLADTELSWIDEESGAPPLRLSEVRVRFENRGEWHRFAVFARCCDDRQAQLRLVGELRGEPHKPMDWRGEVYLQGQGKDLGRVPAGWLPAGLRLGSDTVALESWNRLEAGRISRSLNRIEATGLGLWDESEAADSPPLRPEQVAGLLRWRRVDTGWRLEGKDLVLTRDGTRRPASDLGVRFTPGDDGGWTLAGGNRFFAPADVRDLLVGLSRFLPGGLDRLDAIHPGGGLHDLRFHFVHRPGLAPRWAVSAHVEDLSLAAHGHFPGIRGLTAELAGNERTGWLVPAGSGLILDLPHLFPHPIVLDQVAGAVRWQRERDGTLRVGALEIKVGDADIATRSRFSLGFPAAGGSPFLDLHTEFRDLEATKIRDYIPSKRLRKKLVNWLERAFVGGRVPSGALLFRGNLADFPFDEQPGRFEALFTVRDAILDFHPKWPRLQVPVGEVHFENRGLRVSVPQGRFLDSNLVDVSIGIPDLGRAVAVEIRGRAEGSSAAGLRVLAETPLRKRFGALAKAFKAEGDLDLDLDLAVPLRYKGHKGPLKLTGALSWPGPATLAILDWDIELTELAGKLRLTERTLQAQSIKAKLWDVPIRLDVATEESGENAVATTHIRAKGRFPTAVLARQFPSRFWQSVQGRGRLALDLAFTRGGFGKALPPLDFTLESDLTGLALELPAPLGKSADETRQFHLSGRLPPDKVQGIQGTYGDLRIRLGLDRERNGKHRLVRGTFNLGGPPRSLPKRAGFYLDGSVATLDLRPWLDWWADRKRVGNGGSGASSALCSARMRVGRLLMDGTILNQVRFDLDDRDNRWEAKIGARELAGKATIPQRPRDEPIRVRLARLDLKAVLGQGHKDGKARPVDPRRAHTLDLDIEQFRWGKNPLGRLTLHAQAAPKGLEFTTISLTSPSLSIGGRGNWLWTGAGPRSELSLSAHGSDLGRFLRNLEFKGLFHETPGTVDLNLGWPGAPARFSAADLRGRIRIELGAGSLSEVDPGARRVLGILNFDALQRRLATDFDDLFAPGYAFDKLSGQLAIGNGSVTIRGLLIEGPTADIGITGSADLVAREFDQIMTVTPHIGTSLAVATTVVGGALVGAAVLLADQVSEGAVDKLVRHRYHLTGPWTAPEIHLEPGSEETPTEDENSFLDGP